MSDGALCVRVRLMEPRYHGVPDWPPAPARLFQALVAGAARELAQEDVRAAFLWLERLAPPTIGAPRARRGAPVQIYVPNNDLDAVGGDPARVDKLRVEKTVRPWLLDPDASLLYGWTFARDEASKEHAQTIARIALDLYQVGRGVDMAWAQAEVLDEEALATLLAAHDGPIHRPLLRAAASPSSANGARVLACPTAGTFESLEARHSAHGERFRPERQGRTTITVFTQPPKARARQIAYDASATRIVFELRGRNAGAGFAPVPSHRARQLVLAARDAAVQRLVGAGLDEALVRGVLVGTRPGEAERVVGADRARLVPLPSIGHEHADLRIRRLLVEVPAACPLRADDLRWAFSGLDVGAARLVPGDDGMLAHYGRSSRVWQTVTPAALPAPRRRLEPTLRETKGAVERAREEASARHSAQQAVRHAQLNARPVRIDVQREPHLHGGERAERFGEPERFQKERLWHLRVTFDRAVQGPLVLGDGRFFGLGLMAPADESIQMVAWKIEAGLEPGAEADRVCRHLRRAVLSRADEAYSGRLPGWISGHAPDGGPLPEGEHLQFAMDQERARLVVVAPRAMDGRLGEALRGLIELRAGRAGLLRLTPIELGAGDPLIGPGRRWRSATPYRITRHPKHMKVEEALVEDVRVSCARLGVGRPSVSVLEIAAPAGRGLEARLELEFRSAVRGPLTLGRGRHRGAGLFQLAP